MTTSSSVAPALRGERPRLLDAAADAELAELGYTVVPFLDADTVAALLEDYWRSVPAGDDGLAVDYMRTDRSEYRRMSSLLTETWRAHLGDLVGTHRVAMSTFVAKHPGRWSMMGLHDDRSFVDERRHRALTIWVPLVDVGPDVGNGALLVVPRSHRLDAGWSGSNTPDLIRPFEATLDRSAVPVTARAGDAVVYDVRLLHGSQPNLTDAPRVVAVCAIVPEDAPLVHVVATGRRGRRVYAVDEQFFLDHHPRAVEAAMPEGHRMVDEVLDDAVVTGAHLRDVLRLDAGLAPGDPAVPVPADVGERFPGPPSAPLPRSTSSMQRRAADLVVELGPGSRVSGRGVLTADRATGGTAGSAVVRTWRHVDRAPDVDAATPARGVVPPKDVDLWVLPAGGRLAARVAVDRRWATDLVVIESPVVGAGLRSATAAESLDRGDRLRLPAGESVIVWNEGPGQLVVRVERVISRRAPSPG